jgi:excisionase family DNA binding protein
MTMHDDTMLLDAHRLAKRLGVKRNEIYDWVRAPNPIPAYRVGKNALRFRWSEVMSWLEERRVRR